MLKALGPGAIGIKGLPLAEAVALAREAGFEALVFDVREAAALDEAEGAGRARAMFDEAGVRPGSWSVPVGWRQGENLEAELAALPALAAFARELGSTRATTGVMPGSDERPYDENLAWHADKLRPVADVLADEGCRLGVEFIGPKTFRAPFRYEFVHTLGGALELGAAVGTGNVGVLLDAWHLHCSGGATVDLAQLTSNDVVAVHVNDAPAGVPRDELIDNVRALPLETGVIDLVGFMAALRELGFDGPVMPEPFSARLDELAARDPRAAAAEAGRSMEALWRVAGLA
ncbi:MAG: sugar phosphate isomerase/epimerase [Chloroflexota bacterium]|nr:sugar phosphate isomerase/epimerase [Chloroflexota bacterium]